MPDVYYSPEKLGLSIVMSNDTAGDFEFDKCTLWKHDASNRLFYGFDAGCSCPSPYENEFFETEGENIRTSLQEITARNWEGAAEEMCGRNHFEISKIRTFLKNYFEKPLDVRTSFTYTSES